MIKYNIELVNMIKYSLEIGIRKIYLIHFKRKANQKKIFEYFILFTPELDLFEKLGTI